MRGRQGTCDSDSDSHHGSGHTCASESSRGSTAAKDTCVAAMGAELPFCQKVHDWYTRRIRFCTCYAAEWFGCHWQSLALV